MTPDPHSLEIVDVTIAKDKASGDVIIQTPIFTWHIEASCAKTLGLSILRCAETAAPATTPELEKFLHDRGLGRVM